MKAKLAVFSLIIWGSSAGFLKGQIRSDFVLIRGGFDPHIALDSQGKIHVIASKILEGAYYGLFDSLGNEIRAPRRISRANVAQEPRLSVSDDDVIVVWRVVTPSALYIRGQQLTITGDTVLSTIAFSQYCCPSLFSADVAFLNDSTYIVVWSGEGLLTPSFDGIYGQIATTSQRFIGTSLLLSDHAGPGVDHGRTRVLRLAPSEDFVVVWRDDHLGNHKVFGRLFFSDGTPKDSSFLISENPEVMTEGALSVAKHPEGAFAVVWSGVKDSRRQIQWRQFQPDGTPLGPSERVNSNPDIGVTDSPLDIAFDVDGKCVIVWAQKENGVLTIYAQRYLVDGTPFGNNFRVSGMDPRLEQFSPSVVLRHGRLYTAWSALEDSTGIVFNVRANILDFNDSTLMVNGRAADVPQFFHLYQNYPNPFNPMTRISYKIARQAHIRLAILNILGEEIITLVNQEVMPGTHQVVWDGKDAKGDEAPSGLYLYRLRVNGDYIQTKKMVLLR